MNSPRIWRVYNNGDIKEETRVLGPHVADGWRCTGYGGDVLAWSERNKIIRFGCAQIVKIDGEDAKAIYAGYLDEWQLAAAMSKINLSLLEPTK